ncbi:hypothetical protein AOXY_G1194 [Acipenser oxyrinchus oxyrinchus]|uniref:Uncharacterized protein n=1 Tax=Acipenser oxyrinchus oxyrinchus TaxID=40147 RepID=A0AAD8GKW7_ACIOX|nr:hypothetical protein AOXY_G1194 [Acipenser oxyrinchus oxyrinchus]
MVVHVFLAAFVHAPNTSRAEVVNMMNVTETVVVFFMVNGYKRMFSIVDVGMGYYTVSIKFFMITVMRKWKTTDSILRAADYSNLCSFSCLSSC